MLPRTRCLRALLRRPTLTMPLRSRILAPPPPPQSFSTAAADDPDDVLFTSALGVRTIELNRPAKLNALNGSMVRKIIPRLQEWEKSHLANLIILKGSGPRSLCAGGDVQALSALCKRGPTGAAEAAAYFGLEYQLDHLVATYAKPFVALMDGVTMGGGVGLSVHAPFRIATERTLFAMPETRIGFFPDVGGSFFLPRLDGSVGTYLALTSERLKGVQTLYAGIATHYLHSSSLPDLEQRLSELTFDDHATHSERCRIIDSTIEEFNTGLPDEPIQLSGDLRSSIDHCFSHNTLPEILSTLSTLSTTGAGNPWADHTLTTLRSRSPTSLLVTLRLMRLGLGPDWTITESFQREHSVATRFMSHPDFVSGVDAVLGGADPPVEPVWTPGTVEETTEELAVRFVTPAEGETRLQMLGRAGRDYAAYPYSWGLPSEGEIRAVAEGRKMVVADLVRAVVDGRGGKEGVERKVWDVVGRKMEVVEGFVRWRE